MDVRDRRIIVTGASAGIGFETAKLLASKGARVLAVARSEDGLRRLASQEPTVEPFPADLTKADARAAVVAGAGQVDVLVNNAGHGFTGLVEEMTYDDVRSIVELNLLAMMELTQRVLPQMLQRRAGHIVNMGSIAGYVASPPLTVYSASKFAVHGFTDGLRRELTGRGVNVSLVNPGPVNTRFFARTLVEEGGSESQVPLMTVPPSFVARAVLRTLERDRMMGYDTVAVPRVAGLTRLAQVPGVTNVVDVIARFTRSPHVDSA